MELPVTKGQGRRNRNRCREVKNVANQTPVVEGEKTKFTQDGRQKKIQTYHSRVERGSAMGNWKTNTQD